MYKYMYMYVDTCLFNVPKTAHHNIVCTGNVLHSMCHRPIRTGTYVHVLIHTYISVHVSMVNTYILYGVLFLESFNNIRTTHPVRTRCTTQRLSSSSSVSSRGT